MGSGAAELVHICRASRATRRLNRRLFADATTPNAPMARTAIHSASQSIVVLLPLMRRLEPSA
jgi:hypothetical protein